MAATTVSFGDLPALAGRELGATAFRQLTQDQINTFAEATGDHQWIHTDPGRAARGPFGATIAHGHLTLALAIPFWTELLEVTGVTTKINYGLDKVRFIAPVAVGSRIRMHGTVAAVTEVSGGYQIGVHQVIEIEGASKPAVVAHAIYRFLA